MNDQAQDHQLTAGQRVRYRDTRYTGRVTRVWAWPEDDKFYPGWHGADVTMDNQYSPAPVPVRYQIQAMHFTPLPADYLDDTEAMEAIAAILSSAASASEALTEIILVARRSMRLEDEQEARS
jgi:hypothetical protein